jgi:hypothetical protein
MRNILVATVLLLTAGCAVYPQYPSAGITINPYGIHPYVSPGGVYVAPLGGYNGYYGNGWRGGGWGGWHHHWR